jgi:peptidoglycan/xylan/chitin deacetylase (PgdA/CDA1 family)
MSAAQAHVRDFVGYGRAMPRLQWPDGNRLAVSLVVNYEEGAERSPVEGDPRAEERSEIPRPATVQGRDLAVESYYEYGSRVAIWRVLDLLDRHKMPATFFACAQALEQNPEAARAIISGGHEICCHGYRWIPPAEYSREQEAQEISRAIISIERLCGQRPVGWYSRYAASVNTRELLIEHGGFLYDSDSYADDVPYYVNVRDRPFLTLPYSLDVNDIKFWTVPGFLGAAEFAKYVTGAFDLLHSESLQLTKMLSIGLHLRIAGRPGRAGAIEDILTYLRKRSCAWIARRREIAEWWLQQLPPERVANAS